SFADVAGRLARLKRDLWSWKRPIHHLAPTPNLIPQNGRRNGWGWRLFRRIAQKLWVFIATWAEPTSAALILPASPRTGIDHWGLLRLVPCRSERCLPCCRHFYFLL